MKPNTQWRDIGSVFREAINPFDRPHVSLQLPADLATNFFLEGVTSYHSPLLPEKRLHIGGAEISWSCQYVL